MIEFRDLSNDFIHLFIKDSWGKKSEKRNRQRAVYGLESQFGVYIGFLVFIRK